MSAWPRRVLLGVCWVLAAGFVMHAVVDDIQRSLSLAGVLSVHYPAGLWATLDKRAADIQDLAINEPWFLVEGLLWAAVGWIALGRSRARRWWVGTLLAAIALLTVNGLVVSFGLMGRSIVF